MSSKTKVPWVKNAAGQLGRTWNITVGCTPASPACANCYARALHDMRHAAYERGAKLSPMYQREFAEVSLRPELLDEPLHWRGNQTVFVCDCSDLFHEQVPADFIFAALDVMAMAEQHTFLLLTKRSQRARELLDLWYTLRGRRVLPNVWLGATIENQEMLKERLPHLLNTPAVVGHFASCEPLLGPVKFGDWFRMGLARSLRQIIIGGETQPAGSDLPARPMHPAWVDQILADCRRYDVAVYFKSWGDYRPAYEDHRQTKLARAGLRVWPDGTAIASEGRMPGSALLGEACLMEMVGKRRSGRTFDGQLYNDLAWAMPDKEVV